LIARDENVSMNRTICTLNISKGTIYHKRRPYIRKSCHRKAISAECVEAIKEICRKKSTYGAPRIRAILRRGYGFQLSYYLVHRVMGEEGRLIKRTSNKRPSRRHTGKIKVENPNMRWASDITGIVPWNRDKGRFTYILDCCDRSIIAWKFQRHIQACDIELMMQEALFKRFGGEIPDGHDVEFLHDN